MNRAQLPDEVFGIPQERKYPMPNRRHTISAIKLFNHVEDKYEEQLAKAVIKNMKKYDIDGSMVGDNNRLKKYLSKDMISESTDIPTPVIIKTIKRVTLDYADRVPFGLHINVQKIDKNKKYIGVLILDGPQEYRDTDDARDFLKSVAEDVKYRLNRTGNKVSKIDIGDGDEGCIYIYFKTGIFNIYENYFLEDTGKIKNIIFDLGNVLVSTNMEDLMAVDPDIPNDKINYIMSQWYKDEDDPIGLDEFKSIIPARLKEASKFIPKLFEYNIRCVNPFDYTIPLIDKLKAAGYNVYFLSNWSKWSYELLDRYHKFDFLEKMNGGVWSWQTGCMKPNERIYRILLNKYNLNPEECVFFDDLKDNIEAANDIGIKGVLFDRTNPDNMYINAALEGSFSYVQGCEDRVLVEGLFDRKSKEQRLYSPTKYKKAFDNFARELQSKFKAEVKTDFDNERIILKVDPNVFLSKFNSSHLLSKQIAQFNLEMMLEYDNCIISTHSHPQSNSEIPFIIDYVYSSDMESYYNIRDIKKLISNLKIRNIAPIIYTYTSYITINHAPKSIENIVNNSFDNIDRIKYSGGSKNIMYVYFKRLVKESTAAGTVVGSNQSDSIYIVNYMQNNVFSGHKENRLGICKKGMKDLHTFGGKYDRFHYVSDLDEFKEEASDIKMYRYTGTPKNSFYEIIEDTVNDLDLYKLLTGRDLPDRSFIDYDSEFIQEECFLDTLDAIRECTEAGLLSLTENKYPVPILTETVQGRPYNYYRDLDGVFIQHEVTKIRSKSYRDKNSIPEAQVNAVKRGYLY